MHISTLVNFNLEAKLNAQLEFPFDTVLIHKAEKCSSTGCWRPVESVRLIQDEQSKLLKDNATACNQWVTWPAYTHQLTFQTRRSRATREMSDPAIDQITKKHVEPSPFPFPNLFPSSSHRGAVNMLQSGGEFALLLVSHAVKDECVFLFEPPFSFYYSMFLSPLQHCCPLTALSLFTKARYVFKLNPAAFQKAFH